MSEIVALGYIGIEARDLDAWAAFGTSLVGLHLRERRADGTLVFRADAYAYRLAVQPGPRDDLAFVGWEVRDPDALEQLAERLDGCGVAVTRESAALAAERCVMRLIAFHDPDGNRHEAFVGPLVQPHDPFVSPRGLGPFVTGEDGLGHVVLVTADRERQARFFCDVLGFRLSDVIDVHTPVGDRLFTFVRCSPRHHSLAFAQIPVTRRLAHIMLQMPTIDDVGLSYDLAQAQGRPIAATLGRHTNDRMLSFYVGSPSGFELEIGADPLRVDEETWHVRRYDRTSVWGHDRAPRPAAVGAR
jgi:2,3-dihydroxybiphenyl 1,2-dioxygenase